jgi:hypothetical protein
MNPGIFLGIHEADNSFCRLVLWAFNMPESVATSGEGEILDSTSTTLVALAERNGKFLLTPIRKRVATLLAEGFLTNDQICKQEKVGIQTLWRWRQNPAFMAYVAKKAAQFGSAIERQAISRKAQRMRTYQAVMDDCNRIKWDRSEDERYAGVPGYGTGMMVHTVKSIGSGELAERVDLYAVDTGLIDKILAVNKQAAQEMGQWEETKPAEPPPANPVQINILTPETLGQMTIEQKQAEWRARMQSE